MKKFTSRATRLIAGCLATALALCSGVIIPENGPSNVHAYEQLYDTYNIDAAHFPDPVFRNYVHEAYDKNKDWKMENDEIMEARNVNLDRSGVSSLKGLEYLPEMRGIYASFCNLTELDISKNQLITGIWVSNNKFTKLDFSKNPGLEWLYCFQCPNLTELNVRGNPKMSYLEVNSCPLGKIDVSRNPLLEQLTCASCNLTSLDLSKNHKLTHLDCQNNNIASLDLSPCYVMKRLDIWENPKLSNVDVSMLPHLQYYNCAACNVSSLNLSKNKELVKLNCGWNHIKSLDLSQNTKLYALYCNDNELTSLDLTPFPDLQFLMAYNNPLTSINIGNNPKLLKTYQPENMTYEEEQGFYSYTINYGIDDSYGGLDNKYFLMVDPNVDIQTNSTTSIATDIYFEGDVDTANYLTREMVAQTLYDLAGSPAVSGTSRFTDVEPGEWYYDAVLWGEQNNVCLGFPDMASDTFGVGKWCTKQEMANMVMRWAEYMGYKREIDFGRSDDYIDYFEIAYSCWEGVCWAATYRSFPTEGDRSADKTQQYIKPYKVTSRADLTYIIQGIEEENGRTITATLPIPDASVVPAGIETHGRAANPNITRNDPAIPATLDPEDTTGGSAGDSGDASGGAAGGSTGATGATGATGSTGSTGSGSTAKTGKWVQTDDGQYNYVTDDGNKETNCYRDGCWLDANGNYNPAYCNGTWKCNSTGWWYEDNGWYPYSQWLKIDGYWYYFCSDGYMDYGEYRDGCWLNMDGSWAEGYYQGAWHKNSTGWWYSDGDWYPYSQSLWIDGTKYHFNSDGYWDY